MTATFQLRQPAGSRSDGAGRPLDWESATPQQLTGFIDWLDGCVPGATAGPRFVLEAEGQRVVAYGSSYLRQDGDRTVMEFPHGPAAEDESALLALTRLLQHTEPVRSLVIEPYLPYSEPLLAALVEQGFRPVDRPWVEYTVRVDLLPDDGALLGSFAPKARRAVRYAREQGAAVRRTTERDDLVWFADRHSRMAAAAGIAPAPLAYLERACVDRSADGASLFVLTWRGQRIAGALVLHAGRLGYYQKGFAERTSLGTQYLQFEAMRWLSAHGFRTYDLGGLRGPATADGVSRFKRGIAPDVSHFLPTMRWDPNDETRSA
jgi:hypothetical protein